MSCGIAAVLVVIFHLFRNLWFNIQIEIKYLDYWRQIAQKQQQQRQICVTAKLRHWNGIHFCYYRIRVLLFIYLSFVCIKFHWWNRKILWQWEIALFYLLGAGGGGGDWVRRHLKKSTHKKKFNESEIRCESGEHVCVHV